MVKNESIPIIHYVNTNLGLMPVETYRNLKAQQLGFCSYEEMESAGQNIEIKNIAFVTDKAGKLVRANYTPPKIS